MPKLSVLIPTYRRPWFLREAIASALAQDLGDLEVIVSDDGRQGETVAAEFADGRVRYEPNVQPAGMAANWNRLFELARGDHVALLMDDDRLAPTFASRVVEVLDASPETGVAFTNHTFVGDTETVRPRLLAAGRHDAFTATFVALKPVAVSAAAIRRTALAAAAPLPDTAAADMVLFTRIADAGHAFHYIDEPLMRYRVHEEMFSSSLGFRDDTVRAWESLLNVQDLAARAGVEQRLGEALLGRAAGALQVGQFNSARRDAKRAFALGSAFRTESLAIGVLARIRFPPPVLRAAAAARRHLRQSVAALRATTCS